jgi:hypothetical protein
VSRRLSEGNGDAQLVRIRIISTFVPEEEQVPMNSRLPEAVMFALQPPELGTSVSLFPDRLQVPLPPLGKLPLSPVGK